MKSEIPVDKLVLRNSVITRFLSGFSVKQIAKTNEMKVKEVEEILRTFLAGWMK